MKVTGKSYIYYITNNSITNIKITIPCRGTLGNLSGRNLSINCIFVFYNLSSFFFYHNLYPMFIHFFLLFQCEKNR